MSHNVNTQLIERALELREEVVGTVFEGDIENAIELNDMEHLYDLVITIENYFDEQDFVNYDPVGDTSDYEREM